MGGTGNDRPPKNETHRLGWERDHLSEKGVINALRKFQVQEIKTAIGNKMIIRDKQIWEEKRSVRG